jgi:3-oxoacyl-[acyl-carrier-protein] synthase III
LSERPVLSGLAGYLPNGWMSATAIAEASGIPAQVVVERFGLKGKHIAAPDEHVSDMSVSAATALLGELDLDPATLDVVCYFGSEYKEYPVWQAAPHIAHRLGADRAFALELDYVSCGGPVAVRVCTDLMLAEPHLERVLLVGASRESYLIDYTNERSRFMFNFGDGAVAGLLTKGSPVRRASDDHGPGHRSLLVHASAARTDGSLSLQVKVPIGGSVRPRRDGERRPILDVEDPEAMKLRLDDVTMDNFVGVAREALRRSGLEGTPIALLCPLHMKRSMHDALCTALEVPPERAVYLDDTGHMSGVDTLLGLDRGLRAGLLEAGDVVLLLAAGTGYTWTATVLQAQ